MVLRRLLSRRTLAYASMGVVAGTVGGYWYLNSGPSYPPSTLKTRRPPPPWAPPSRHEMLERLRKSARSSEEEFDLLVVGGGATGAGVAVDAATRGLKVALVERSDFSSGTSSKSTKLVHGGVRYLQKAVMELDYEQYKLVKEALRERRIFLETAPYLSNMLPIMLPVYKYWQIPYYWAGCKLYDVLAGKENMESSYVMSKGKALEAFPMLKQDGLVGAIVYYDGQHNDTRMNMALIMTAVKHGATVANYVEVTELEKDAQGKLRGATVKDNLTGKSWPVKAKGIINATGPFSDAMLTLDNPKHEPIVAPAAGVHITLPNYYAPRNMGLLDPQTSDGRVIFFLPWQGNTIAGTTDSPCRIETDPEPKEEDIDWVLDEVRHYLSPDIKVRRGDVLSAWSGIRPLVRNPNAAKTEGLVRNHMIHVSDSGLLTIAGGKWTTYRAMAEETVDEAVKVFGLHDRLTSGCRTDSLHLVGTDGWSRTQFIGLIQRFGLESEVAKHLSENYGDCAWTVCGLASPTNDFWPQHGRRLSKQYPFIEAEVRYACRYEYAQTAMDVLARRTRLAFLNAHAALLALPRVIEIMSEEMGWTAKRRAQELEKGVRFLKTMGLAHLAPDSDMARALDSARGRSSFDTLRDWLGLQKSYRPRRPTPSTAPEAATPAEFARAQFTANEMGELRAAFVSIASSSSVNPSLSAASNSSTSTPVAASPGPAAASSGAALVSAGETSVDAPHLRELLRSLPGYERVREEDLQYVLAEAGLEGRQMFDFPSFLELCAGLKEIIFRPEAKKEERLRIPVEKSGGGV